MNPHTLKRFIVNLNEIAKESQLTTSQALTEYLDNVPFTEKEIQTICNHLGLDSLKYIHSACSNSDIEAYNQQFE